ncbi:MAG TPA: globin [Acidimicrobiales bacterium]|nr:globin [Acidimicrobiales bacterium]
MTGSLTLYDRVGGRPFFEALTERFYESVSADPVLARLYPSDPEAFEAARRHLELFLVQYWGGPAQYQEQRGHPRLRQRHAPFVIGPAERDAWVAHMSDAVRAAHLAPLDEMQMLGYLTTAADHLVNQA